jgi:alkanesulfonate monooxygenase SsuD/methylene tetrahydromethanopterin reductase-like flavin-dependent oxidoreductase (luciferase family)
MHRPFRFGVVTGNAQSHTEWVTLARKAEELGYATLLIPDRTTMGLAPFTALAVAAEATTALRIGSFVFCNDYRHPALLAKEVATLDLLSLSLTLLLYSKNVVKIAGRSAIHSPVS